MWHRALNPLIELPLHVHKHLHIDLNPLACCSEMKKETDFFFVPDFIFPDGIKIEFSPD
jgi:hypothetical protein